LISFRISPRATREFPSVDARHANVGDQQRQARFALYLLEALGAVLRANNVISAIDKEFFQEDANPIIIVDDDQHVARDSITDGK
jgi:hypothetical protein